MSARRWFVPLLAALSVALASCGDQVQKAKPPERPASPHGGLPAGHPEIGRQAPPPSPHAGADPFAETQPGGKPAMEGGKIEDPDRVVYSGRISIDPSVELGASYTVYVLTVNERTERIPVLVRRYETPKFPFEFELRERDSGMGPRTSERPLYLRAQISDTGDVMKSRNRTTSEQPYAPFATGIELTIKP
jgi:hypothetical protein